MRNLEREILLSTREVADFCHVNPRTVQRWIGTEQLKAVKLGPRIWRIRECDLNEFINAKNTKN